MMSGILFASSMFAILPFLMLINYGMVDSIRSPLVVLDHYEGSGIRLTCKAEEIRSPELLQLSWVDNEGKELPTTLTFVDNTSIANSILLESGSGNAVSCRIMNKSSRTPLGSTSLYIADNIFPSTSPCMVGFFVIAVASIVVIIATVYKLKQDKTKIRFAENDKRALEEKKLLLACELEKEKEKSLKALKEAQYSIEEATAQLDFIRRAQSNAVTITLDSKCTHAKLSIRGKNEVRLDPSHTKQKEPQGALIAVANQKHHSGKIYWEVEVGGKADWELGVLTKKAKEKLEKENLEKPLEDGYVSMRWYQGQYHCNGGSSLSVEENGECEVVGVFLDVEEHMLSFYDIQKMCLIRAIAIKFSEDVYPFFHPGNDEKYLGVRPLTSTC